MCVVDGFGGWVGWGKGKGEGRTYLVDFGQALFVPVLEVLGEKFEFFGDFFQGLGVVGGEADFLPELRWRVRPFGRLCLCVGVGGWVVEIE